VKADKKNRLIGEISKAEKNKPNTIGKVTWKFMTK
jgi:alpha-D-xyloside xylohydrolase